jgi:threonine dehydrogenase-like Zn-dependent dehydrogenase
MRAIQIVAPGRFEVVELPRPAPGPDEVLVEIQACNTCTHWDMTIWKGADIFERPGHPRYPQDPGAPGHEWAGVVVACGPGATRLAPGDHVALWGSVPGQRRNVLGGYAGYVVMHQDAVVKAAPHLPFEEAAAQELLTCVATSILRAGEVAGTRVGVSGLGPAGLLAVQALKARGAAEVYAFDLLPARLELARSLGADTAIVPQSPAWESLRKDQLDVTIDCSGAGQAISAALKVTRGRVLVFGVPHGPIDWGIDEWRRGVTLEGYGRRLRQAAGYAQHLLATGQVKAGPLISARLPFERYAEGVELLLRREAIKVSFQPHLGRGTSGA